MTKALHLNISVVCNKSGNNKEVIYNCTQALDIDPKATKAYFLRAQAQARGQCYDEALFDIKEAIKLAPADKSFREEFESIKAQKKKGQEAEIKAAQALFSKGLYNEKVVTISKNEETRLPTFLPANPQVFFDISIGKEGEEGHHIGRVVFELFPKKVPKTVENFRSICTGEKGEQLHYKNSIFHRVISGFMMQGGDITHANGTGGLSIYGQKFNDENVWLPHTHGGLLSMANSGPNTNGSQFFITFKDTPHLNGKHIVFGRVVSGYDICQKVEETKSVSDKPVLDVRIVECGELTGDKKLSEEQCDYLSNYAQPGFGSGPGAEDEDSGMEGSEGEGEEEEN